MKIHIKIPLIFLITLLVINSVCADGWHISDHDLHLYEPNQKAVISWDGTTETMILASAVKSNNIANFAWVVPIQSYSKPEVTAGNISIFEDLVDYFKKPSRKLGIMGTLSADFAGVNILETKEIDVYDITILQATNSNDLIDWLNNNDYKVPTEAKPILDKYVAKGDFYFIANKIDLTNKFAEELETAKKEIEEIKSYDLEETLEKIKSLDYSNNNHISLSSCTSSSYFIDQNKLNKKIGITDDLIADLEIRFIIDKNTLEK